MTNKTNQTEDKQGNWRLEQYCKLTRTKRHLWDILLKREYTSFSGTHGTFSRTDDMLGQKTSLNRVKRIEIVHSMFSDHNGMKLNQ